MLRIRIPPALFAGATFGYSMENSGPGLGVLKTL
jgi:hypothetical protein